MKSFIAGLGFIALLAVASACSVEYIFNEELLYAEITQVYSDGNKLLLKAKNHEAFTAYGYELIVISTNTHTHPMVSATFGKNDSGQMIPRHLEIDLPTTKNLEDWKKAFHENKPMVLYPTPKSD